MPTLEADILRLSELALRVQNLRALLEGEINVPLAGDERTLLEALLARSLREKAEVEDRLRRYGPG